MFLSESDDEKSPVYRYYFFVICSLYNYLFIYRLSSIIFDDTIVQCCFSFVSFPPSFRPDSDTSWGRWWGNGTHKFFLERTFQCKEKDPFINNTGIQVPVFQFIFVYIIYSRRYSTKRSFHIWEGEGGLSGLTPITRVSLFVSDS